MKNEWVVVSFSEGEWKVSQEGLTQEEGEAFFAEGANALSRRSWNRYQDHVRELERWNK